MRRPRFSLRLLLVVVTIAAIGFGIGRPYFIHRDITQLDAAKIEMGQSKLYVRYLLGRPQHAYNDINGGRTAWLYEYAEGWSYLFLTFENGRVASIEHDRYNP